jgi:hypothetical protein
MNPILEICLDTTAILTIVWGTAGLLLSLGLIFFPERTRRIDAFLSRNYQLKERLAYFDQTIRQELFIYRRPVLWGVLFMLGATVTLIFLFSQLDLDHLLAVLPIEPSHRLLWQIALETLIWAGKLAGTIGVCIGLFLMIAPGRLRRIESRLNAWVATQPLVDRLDVFNHVVNVFSFRHPVLIGTVGVILSITLITLSIISFF